MLLTFSAPNFEGLIKDGIKIHTIREDKTKRWKKGMKIHFWMGNPRNIHAKRKPYAFGEGIVAEVYPIHIYPNHNRVEVDGPPIVTKDLDFIAKNDGFKDWEAMKQWFNTDFKGRLIIWERKSLIFY